MTGRKKKLPDKSKFDSMPGPDIDFASIRPSKPSPGKLSPYKKRLLALSAIELLPKAVTSLAKLIDMGDKDAIELTLKTYDMVQQKPLVSFNNSLNQNNAQDNRKVEAHGVLSIDQIAREIHFGRMQKQVVEGLPTPAKKETEEE